MNRCVSAGRTDTGKLRGHNEDALLMRDEIGLWVVADGLGGHAAGEFASQLIIDRLGTIERPDDLGDFIDRIDDTLIQINADLRAEARRRQVDIIGSTVVVLVRDEHHMLCGWIGDSRAYGCEGGELSLLTRDHVRGVADRVTAGSAVDSLPPGGGVLTRAVGADDAGFPDWVAVPCGVGTQFLLCSDGINKEMSDQELEVAFRQAASPEAMIDSLFATALARGARDNVTAIVIHVQS